jgi:uracil-DNA glycosylase
MLSKNYAKFLRGECMDILDEIYKEYINEFENEEIVLGDGNREATLMLIGEAPGKDEVLQHKPFVGKAGLILTQFLDVIKLNRSDIFISNCIKYRLSKTNEITGRKSNRPATKRDTEKNRNYLIREISAISPSLIVTLGNVPLKTILNNNKITIGEVHGSALNCKISENFYSTLFPLYHPASIIYNQSLKQVYDKDIEILRDFLKNCIKV